MTASTERPLAGETGLVAPDWMTADDARLNIEGDLLGIVTKRGGERIVAGPVMDSLLSELLDYVLSERAAAFRERVYSGGPDAEVAS